MNLPTKVINILYVFSIAIVFLCSPMIGNAQVEETPELPPETYQQAGLFPVFPLMCPEGLSISAGPTWRTITIGQSTLDDIENLYGVRFTLDDQPAWVTESFAPAYSVLLTAEGARRWELPQSADLCLADGRIAVLSLSLNEEFPSGWIEEWVKQYGVPELVVWEAIGNDWCWRVVIWPQHGLAASVDVSAIENHPGAALVNSVTLFPYPQAENYLSTWPYTSLNNQPPTSSNKDCPTEKNPFDFDALLPEVTDQP